MNKIFKGFLMQNFEYYNPVKIYFGKDSIGHLPTLLQENKRILFVHL